MEIFAIKRKVNSRSRSFYYDSDDDSDSVGEREEILCFFTRLQPALEYLHDANLSGKYIRNTHSPAYFAHKGQQVKSFVEHLEIQRASATSQGKLFKPGQLSLVRYVEDEEGQLFPYDEVRTSLSTLKSFKTENKDLQAKVDEVNDMTFAAPMTPTSSSYSVIPIVSTKYVDLVNGF